MLGVFITKPGSGRERPDHHQPGVLHLRGRLVPSPASWPRSSTCRRPSPTTRASPLESTRHQRWADGDPRVIAWRRVIGIVIAAGILALTGYFTGTEYRRSRTSARPRSPARRPSSCRPLGRLRVGRLHGARDRRGRLRGLPARQWSLIVSLFAVSLAGSGLLTTVGVIVAMDTFGPVSDNAQGIAEMYGDVSRGGRADPHRARRRRQHHQGHHQGHRDRHGGVRRDRAVRLLRHLGLRRSGKAQELRQARRRSTFFVFNPACSSA